MSSSPRTVIFPLASNAKALLAGGPVDSVRRRLKLCSLFFDRVFVEQGAIHITAGPSGSMTLPVLPSKDGYRWQSPATRKRGGEPVRLFVRTEGEPQVPWQLAMQTKTTINWCPTFEPFRNELPGESAKWLQFVGVNPNPQLKLMVNAGLRADQQIEAVRRKLPDAMVRDQVLRGLNGDLAASGLGGVAISVDAQHRQILACRRDAGKAVPVCGPSSLRLLFPSPLARRDPLLLWKNDPGQILYPVRSPARSRRSAHRSQARESPAGDRRRGFVCSAALTRRGRAEASAATGRRCGPYGNDAAADRAAHRPSLSAQETRTSPRTRGWS
ncbi:hypothetical protein ENSA7_22480 [Enhygromyxa salina]|uniref:Uncharacterized protein n=1 Tax=Enhygromyxa salina TaxID=215803 RepID=A0A2S9YSL5_9BACT|nr:hypothetical protein ENSA7_22480 [Enhygromyxa salina]